MKRSLLKTGDGSYTLRIPEWDEQYHSKHGAIAEALHVFIKNGLQFWCAKHPESRSASILEIGFGTGLNCYLTLLEAAKNKWDIDYTGVEAYPLSLAEVEKLNYPELLGSDPGSFLELHQIPWEMKTKVSNSFRLTKKRKFFSEIVAQHAFDIVYFDAFGIRVQPELWTEDIFRRMFEALKPQGVLVTYAANGTARRALQAVGFEVERLPGPPGKKEMLRGSKP